eukprot:2979218-Rhodomonas_salina.4
MEAEGQVLRALSPYALATPCPVLSKRKAPQPFAMANTVWGWSATYTIERAQLVGQVIFPSWRNQMHSTLFSDQVVPGTLICYAMPGTDSIVPCSATSLRAGFPCPVLTWRMALLPGGGHGGCACARDL